MVLSKKSPKLAESIHPIEWSKKRRKVWHVKNIYPSRNSASEKDSLGHHDTNRSWLIVTGTTVVFVWSEITVKGIARRKSRCLSSRGRTRRTRTRRTRMTEGLSVRRFSILKACVGNMFCKFDACRSEAVSLPMMYVLIRLQVFVYMIVRRNLVNRRERALGIFRFYTILCHHTEYSTLCYGY